MRGAVPETGENMKIPADEDTKCANDKSGSSHWLRHPRLAIVCLLNLNESPFCHIFYS